MKILILFVIWLVWISFKHFRALSLNGGVTGFLGLLLWVLMMVAAYWWMNDCDPDEWLREQFRKLRKRG